MSKYWPVENQSSAMFRPGDRFQRMTRRSAFANGNGRIKRAWVTLNTAVLAPMLVARVRTAAAVKPGDWRNVRAAERRSSKMPIPGLTVKSGESIGFRGRDIMPHD